MNSALHLTHLSEDQIDDALIGDLAADCAEHLVGCEACQLRLAEAEAPITIFNDVSLAWSERRSATLPSLAPVASSAWLSRALWGAVAAAALAVGIMVPAWHRFAGNEAMASYHQAVVPAAPVLMASTGPIENSVPNPVKAREEQIARDNELLAAIDRELSAPPNDYGPQSAGHTHTSRHSAAVTN